VAPALGGAVRTLSNHPLQRRAFAIRPDRPGGDMGLSSARGDTAGRGAGCAGADCVPRSGDGREQALQVCADCGGSFA